MATGYFWISKIILPKFPPYFFPKSSLHVNPRLLPPNFKSIGSCTSQKSTRPMASEPEANVDYMGTALRGKFVNTTRGSRTPFPDISLDDLALEFFFSPSPNNNGVVDRRWASHTASSRRRARSVSKTRGAVAFTSSTTTSGGKNATPPDEGSRRRRSLSVARYQISDSESEVDNSWNSCNHNVEKTPFSQNNKNSSVQKAFDSKNRRLGRSRSHKNLSTLHAGYSSHSSALTDDDSKDSHFGKNGFGKIIRAVYAEKSEHLNHDAADGGLHEVMRKELRHAVEEIRIELNQEMRRNQSAIVSEKYASKLEQLEKHKPDHLTAMLFEQPVQEVSKPLDNLPSSMTLAASDKPSRARKRSSDRSRVSKKIIDEAESIFEDFLCNFGDADISSFDGERSDGCSTLGGTTKTRDTATRETEAHNTPVETDGVILPWLQWETSHDNVLFGKNKTQAPVTPKALKWDSEKDLVPWNNPSGHSASSNGSWSPGTFQSPNMDNREDAQETRQVTTDSLSSFDMDVYHKLKNDNDLLFEMYREQNRVNSGSLLLCTTGIPYWLF